MTHGTRDAVRIVLDVLESEDSDRLDRVVAGRVHDISRSYAQQLMKSGDVLVNGDTVKPAHRVRPGDKVEIHLPPVAEPEDLPPDYLPIPIIYEDDDLMVFDKPPGIVTHPAPGHERGTLVNALRAIRPDLRFNNERLGVVHRLDKDTSGLIVVAKHEESRLWLLHQWQERQVVKRYIALVQDPIEENRGTIDAPISRDPNNRKRMAVVREGRPAISHFDVIQRFADSTLVNIHIETGRTHQIRVHMAFIGHPVVGDSTYGRKRFSVEVPRQFLHAAYLKFELPGNRGPLELETPIPNDLQTVLDALQAV
ncbi:MAG: RluA family pseudouridine synthase [Sphaerobacteraceae bacterium]|nr:MAG: RluA family pseudouridine synthase [Sphaerobacteraceae bacterium]